LRLSPRPDDDKSPGGGWSGTGRDGEDQDCGMQLFLRDPSYTDRLAAFLTSVGRRAVVGAPDRVDLEETPNDSQHLELELYLRVWRVLYPDADVELAAA
jgi:hypothetical protein